MFPCTRASHFGYRFLTHGHGLLPKTSQAAPSPLEAPLPAPGPARRDAWREPRSFGAGAGGGWRRPEAAGWISRGRPKSLWSPEMLELRTLGLQKLEVGNVAEFRNPSAWESHFLDEGTRTLGLQPSGLIVEFPGQGKAGIKGKELGVFGGGF